MNKGPGLPRVDPTILEKETIRVEVVNRLKEIVHMIPSDWDPNRVWEFLKVSVRSIMWEITAREKKIENKEIEAIKAQLNRLRHNKETLCCTHNPDLALLNDIETTIMQFENSLDKEWERKSKSLALKAKVKWFNEGEKSNKYFLNIIKKRQSETLLTNLNWGERNASTQKEIQDLVVDFYAELYEKKTDLNTDYESFFSPDTPTLNDEDRAMLDREITLDEITRTLKSCGESSPGQDGITYKTYQALWEVLGPFSLKSWNYSVATGNLPESQKNSSITLLPKEGKDTTEIGNWRPILTNCDLKIYTKNLANRVAGVLDKVIFETQTAYIPGRNVHNNLRMFEFYREYCNKNNVDAILMSLDAKKAFDSVDHKYMAATLKKYGFSDNFIDLVKMLYRDIKADILVNGYRSVCIKIGRCVKQGDALSCALFILCLDPLIRNIERNKKIKPITIRLPLSNLKLENKTGVFADDVGVVTESNEGSIKEVYLEYRKFSERSGICLNETKTEILTLKKDERVYTPTQFIINLPETSFTLKSVRSITICGIAFSNDPNISFRLNIRSKIDKLKSKLLAWQYRGLSLGGKVLVTKTFGISQLIYTMQMCDYDEKSLKEIESFIFGFLWSKNVAIAKAPDRIKRKIMVQDFGCGGLRVPDIQAMNSALKTKQFLKASEGNHIMKLIQKYHLEKAERTKVIQQEYSKLCNADNVIMIAQITLNELTDKWRRELVNKSIEGVKIDLIASTDVKEYLKRKKLLLSLCLFERLFRSGIKNFKQLVMEQTYPRSESFANISSTVLREFPLDWVKAILDNIECNSKLDIRENIMLAQDMSSKISTCTVRAIRNRLVTIENLDKFKFEQVLNIIPHEGINPFETARKVNYSTSQKIFKFRLLHLDIFTNQRMFKFKMIDDDKCTICGEIETIKHAIWDCNRAKLVWDYVKRLIVVIAPEIDVTLGSLFIGFNPTNPIVETILTRITQRLLSYDRSSVIVPQELRSILGQYATLNTNDKCRFVKARDHDIWNRVKEWCKNGHQ